MNGSERRMRSIAGHLASAYRTTSLLVALTLAAAAGSLAAVLFHFQPDVENLLALQAGVQLSHDGMLDQETGLRGFLSTGDTGFLQPYTLGKSEVAQGDVAYTPLAATPNLTSAVITLRIAEQRWISEWADEAVVANPRQISSGQLGVFLAQGKTLFDSYRTAESATLQAVSVAVAAELSAERVAIATGLGIALVSLGVSSAFTWRQRHRLRSAVVRPLDELMATIDRIKSGDLTTQAVVGGPEELQQLAEALSSMSETLSAERDHIVVLEAESRTRADHLHLLVELSRETTGSLSPRYISQAVGTAATSISGFAAARIWLTSDREAHLSLLSQTGHEDHGEGVATPTEMGAGTIGRAAQQGRVLSSTASGAPAGEHRTDEPVIEIAVPMIVGGRVVGVIELFGDRPQRVTSERLDVITTLAGQAGTALEAARLHAGAKELSQTDVLTQLGNRRRFDADLATEVARTARYGGPLSLLMLDVDHFKEFNDRFGHQAGDDILSELAAAMVATLRTTDTAYRFGGEEFCILLRESDANAAELAAERLRGSVETRFASAGGASTVTVSIGAAAIPEHARSAETLVSAADAAMYAAKRAGRNRVVRATPSALTTAPRVVGDAEHASSTSARS